jgi:hypothetical protein
MNATDCSYCTPGELRAFRVEVCGQIIAVQATHGRQAKMRARRRYVDTHDWFISDDPWAVTRGAKVLDPTYICQLKM